MSTPLLEPFDDADSLAITGRDIEVARADLLGGLTTLGRLERKLDDLRYELNGISEEIGPARELIKSSATTLLTALLQAQGPNDTAASPSIDPTLAACGLDSPHMPQGGDGLAMPDAQAEWIAKQAAMRKAAGASTLDLIIHQPDDGEDSPTVRSDAFGNHYAGGYGHPVRQVDRHAVEVGYPDLSSIEIS